MVQENFSKILGTGKICGTGEILCTGKFQFPAPLSNAASPPRYDGDDDDEEEEEDEDEGRKMSFKVA